ncbi:hypothetical protein Gbfr_002_002 [Gluconobacter frateurii M-2]|nr:hypothetical protein Gbfr_002_002 [Gluconobacter frateurii M-2]
MSGNQTDATPWSIRGVPSDVKQAAVSHAKTAGVGVGEWIASAIREKIKADRNAGKKVAVRQVSPVSLTDATQAVDLVVRMASAGLTVPDHVQKTAFQLVNRVAQDVKRGQTNDQTKGSFGHDQGE